jgi:hypothetical protein
VAGELARKSCVIDTDTAIRLEQEHLGGPAGGVEIAVDIASQYRASLAIDWRKSLLGWWRFRSGQMAGADTSGREASASLNSGAVSGDGWFGSGVRLNGSGAYVNANTIAVAKNGRATIEGWFRFRSFAMDNKVVMGIFSGMYQHDVNNYFYFEGTNDYFAAASLLQLDAWHHIALTWNGDAATAYLYIDGRQLPPVIQGTVEDVPAIDGLRIGDHVNFLGKLLARSNGTFDGDIDEVRVWNRVLSPQEIQASYDANSNRLRVVFPAASGLKSDWSIIGANAADEMLAR